MDNKNGHWYTDKNGNHYFVENGQTPKEGWEESHRRKMVSGNKKMVSEDGNDFREATDEEYNKFEADEVEFDENNEDDFGDFDEDDLEAHKYDNLDNYLEWEGIIGYNDTLREIWRDKEAMIDGELESFDTPEEAVRAYLEWEGIMGYDDDIINFLREEEKFDEYSRNYEPNQDTLPNHLRDADYQEGHDYERDMARKHLVRKESNPNAKYEDPNKTEKKWNIGSDKSYLTEEEYNKLDNLRARLVKEGLPAKLTEGYEDYGADMKWNNISIDSTWGLYPNEWINFMNGDLSEDELVNTLKDRFKDKIRVTEREEAQSQVNNHKWNFKEDVKTWLKDSPYDLSDEDIEYIAKKAKLRNR